MSGGYKETLPRACTEGNGEFEHCLMSHEHDISHIYEITYRVLN